MKNNRVWPILAIILGILISSIGGILVVSYILEAIVKRAGDPDQSLLFWYLPILFMGIIGLIIGAVSGIWGALVLKKVKKR